jgi:hypothetical protein
VIAAAVALSLLATQAPPLAQEEWGEAPWEEDEAEEAPRLFLTAWGGEALGEVGGGQSSAMLGGEVAWAFRALDLGLAGYGYRRLADAEREWTPVALVRLVQRFRTRAGLEATFALGIGGGRPDGWTAWYQVALGGRAMFGPMFVSGEISFEQYDLLRLAGGLGLAF